MQRKRNGQIYRILLFLTGCAAGVFVWLYHEIPEISRPEPFLPVSEQSEEGVLHRSPLDDVEAAQWSVVNAEAEQTPSAQSQLNTRFRLAGTFFSYDQRNKNARVAIVDDLKSRQQKILGEGDLLAEYSVVAIQRDRMELEGNGRREVLLLSFSGAKKPDTTPVEAPASSGETVLNENRFGKQVAENRWVLKREALMDYYDELLDDPERIAAIYISLKPDYDASEKIRGYDLDMIGENAFFEAVGLQQGDIIRKVNSMSMVSQARGEYFLKEFVNNRLNAVVIDIERDSVPKKMIYLLR